MKIHTVKSEAPHPNPHKVDVRKLYDHEHAQAMHITLHPGEKLLRHITPVDVFFYILEGKGTVEIGDETEKVEPDMVIESPARIPHCLMNDGEKGIFRVLVVKAPRPTESTRIL